MKYLNIDEVKPGMILASTIYDNNARILLASNKSLSSSIIARLRMLKFNKVCVYDKDDESCYKSLLDDDIRQSALRNLKNLDIDNCLYIANTITNQILNDPDYVYNLQSIGSYDNITFDHSINVAILSTMIGVSMGFDNQMLKKITLAGLLHDIGKTSIDHNIIAKEGKLTNLEYDEVKNHPAYGLAILRQNCLTSAVVLNAVYSHHENEDGTGYPRGLKGNKIHIVAKILHAVDVYDALVSKRSYKDSVDRLSVMNYMISNIGTLFDETVVRNLIKCVSDNNYTMRLCA